MARELTIDIDLGRYQYKKRILIILNLISSKLGLWYFDKFMIIKPPSKPGLTRAEGMRVLTNKEVAEMAKNKP